MSPFDIFGVIMVTVASTGALVAGWRDQYAKGAYLLGWALLIATTLS